MSKRRTIEIIRLERIERGRRHRRICRTIVWVSIFLCLMVIVAGILILGVQLVEVFKIW